MILIFQVDTSADGMVDWNEFCTYMLLHYKENDVMKRKQAVPFTDQPKIRHISPNRVSYTYSKDIIYTKDIPKVPMRSKA